MFLQSDGHQRGKTQNYQLLKLSVFCMTYVFMRCLCQGQSCDQTLTGLEGTFHSPLYPLPYPNNQECVYLITLPPLYRATITFHHFQLEPLVDNRCLDFVEVRDGGSRLSPLVSQYFCEQGYVGPTTSLRSSGSQMWVRFVSNGQNTFPGFNASYTADTLGDNFTLVVDTTYNHIYRLDRFTLSYISTPLPQLYHPKTVDCDPRSQPVRMFWTEFNDSNIYTAALDGSDKRIVTSLGDKALLADMAVDPTSNLIFYVDTGHDVIGVASVSTRSHRSLVNTDGNVTVNNIVVDYKERALYWTEGSSIQRSSYSGSDRTTLIQLCAQYASLLSLTLDPDNGDLYWLTVDLSGRQRVESSQRDGQGQRLIFPKETQTPGYIFSVLSFYDSALWLISLHNEGGQVSSQLQRMGADGPSFVWKAHNYRVGDLAFFDSSLPLPGSTGCRRDNGGCSYICIPLPGNGTQCMCPDGRDLGEDNQTCSSPADDRSGTSTSVSSSTKVTQPTDDKHWSTETAHTGEDNSNNMITIIVSSVVGAAALVIIIAVVVICRVRKKRTGAQSPAGERPRVLPRRGVSLDRRNIVGHTDTDSSTSEGEHYTNIYDLPASLYMDMRGYDRFSPNDVKGDTDGSNVPEFRGEDSQGYMIPVTKTTTTSPSRHNASEGQDTRHQNEYIPPDPPLPPRENALTLTAHDEYVKESSVLRGIVKRE